MKIYTNIPTGHGECPICHGTGIHKLTPEESAKYWKNPTEIKCRNCGGQTMGGKTYGYVRLHKDNGRPCVHEYKGRNVSRCYTVYDCPHCGDRYDIDSGD
jgi:hypothetical protein